MRIDPRTLAVAATLMITALVPLAVGVEAPEVPATPDLVTPTKQAFWDAQGCTQADASGNVGVIAPPAGFVLSWMSPCVVIPNGGTVTFTQADGIPHGAVSKASCFDLGRMSAVGGTPAASDPSKTSLKLDFIAEEGLAYTFSNGIDLGACSSFVETEDTITIDYQCIIHGAAMSAKIIVEL